VSLAPFVALIAGALHEAEIPFMLTGSLAAAFYGAPRATQDLDLVIESESNNLRHLVTNLQAKGLYADLGSALDALQTTGQFNVIDPETGWKADLIIRKQRPFSEAEFGRRQERQLFGVAIALATLEDLIIAKLEWSELGDSELQRRDIRELLEMAGVTLDRTYLAQWIAALDLEPAWKRVSQAGSAD
jgi:hypothetical protein